MEDGLPWDQRLRRTRNALTRNNVIIAIQYVLFLAIFYVIVSGVGQALRRRAIWIGLALVAVFLSDTDNRFERLLNPVFILITVLSMGYIVINYVDLQTRLIGVEPIELVLGTLFLIVVLDGTRRSMEFSGIVLAALTGLSLLFMVSGHLVLGIINQPIQYSRIIDEMYLSVSGPFSFILGTVIDYVIPFIVFGKTLEVLGGTEYFINLSKYVTRKMTAGPAKLAVVASALMGMISGTVVGNIATTGAITIPTMKRSGVESNYAAAIESAASTGGQIMPPIMGIAIFIMVNITGIPYIEIASRSVIPAAIYFTIVFLYIHLLAQRDDAQIVQTTGDEIYEEMASKRELLLKSYYFLPVLLIVALLIRGIPIPNVGIYATLLVVVVGLARPASRIDLTKSGRIVRESMDLSISLIIITASIGIIVTAMGATGLSLQFTSLILSLSGGTTVIILVLTMIASILLGMGMSSTVVAYILLATLIAPALVNIGLKPLVAHLFVFYFGMFALITPPVGVGIFTAAGMADADGMDSGIKAMKICLPGFLLPYLFVLNDGLLLYGGAMNILTAVALTIVILGSFTVFLVGYLRGPLRTVERVLFLLVGLLGLVLMYYS